MIHLTDEYVIRARARLAQAIADMAVADSRVRRLLRLSFDDDGGAEVAIELHEGPDDPAVEVVAEEVELAMCLALPQLPWVRVQVA